MPEIHLAKPSSLAIAWLNEWSHGLVYKRPDGLQARCFGPPTEDFKGCQHCEYEEHIVGLLIELGAIERESLGPMSKITTYEELDGKVVQLVEGKASK